MTADIDAWTSRITSQHRDKPKFMASLEAILQPLGEMRDLVLGLPQVFDLDEAAGVQLDIVGKWIGVTREIAIPLTDIYFSLDIEGLGLDQGSLWATGDPLASMSSLPDDAYRLLLRSRIASNHWDGTIPGAYAVWDALLSGAGYSIKIEDVGHMHMTCILLGTPDAVISALFSGGYLNIKPAGVRAMSIVSAAQTSYHSILSGGALGESSLGEL